MGGVMIQTSERHIFFLNMGGLWYGVSGGWRFLNKDGWWWVVEVNERARERDEREIFAYLFLV
ncbi:hypothetical protein Hanom_Chr04g00375891 [Helianthus anomalus]